MRRDLAPDRASGEQVAGEAEGLHPPWEWGGKLRLAHHTRDYARRIAQHEMGHYVVSRVLGFRTGGVELEITHHIEGHRGGADTTLPQSLREMADVVDYLERRVQILFAGAQSETLQPCRVPIGRVDQENAVDILRRPRGGAEQDQAKVRELIHILRSIRHPDTDFTDKEATQAELNAIDNDLWNRTVALVEKHAETIMGLGGNLADRVKDLNQRVVMTAAELERIPAVVALTTPDLGS